MKMPASQAGSLVIECFGGLSSRPVTWLWPGRLARGKLAIFDGDPGLGKSLVALDLCARLTTSAPLPDGAPSPGPGNVIIFHGEDAAEDTLNPRLDSLGADRNRVFHAHCRSDLGHEPLSFPMHLNLLEEALERLRPLVVLIDPIMAFLDRSVSAGDDPGVRKMLGGLAQLAEKHDCVMLLIRHLNKHAGKRSLYRGTGSMAFLAVCRSAWLFARHPSRKNQAVIAQVKNNLAAPQVSLAYEVVARPNMAPQLVWRGTSNLDAGELLHWADRVYPPRYRARDFLSEFLKQGPRPSKEVWDAGKQLHLSERTIDRARKELKIKVVLVVERKKNIYYWVALGQKVPYSTRPAIRAFEKRIEEIEKTIPEPNPLDPSP
jgi:hypothetical protein